ncbi:MAG TPA: hypothetical protein VLT81_15925 [Chondromyces sp.]|nr:hypothetical protein [Chondromyces sp.]
MESTSVELIQVARATGSGGDGRGTFEVGKWKFLSVTKGVVDVKCLIEIDE